MEPWIPFAPSPDQAVLGEALIALLQALAVLPGVSVAVVSGRTRESLEGAFRDAPRIWLAAEYGGWLRAEGAWHAPLAGVAPDPGELDALALAFSQIAAQYEHAWVERKTWAVCLHYRGVRRRERMGLLVQANAAFAAHVADHPGYEHIEAPKAFEVASTRLRKGVAIPWIRERAGGAARLLVLGDDLPDEEMFRALGPGATSDPGVQVGEDPLRATAARWRLPDPAAAVAFLQWILAVRREAPTPPGPACCARRGLPLTPRPVAEGAGRRSGSPPPRRLEHALARAADAHRAGGGRQRAPHPARRRRAPPRNVGGLVSVLGVRHRLARRALGSDGAGDRPPRPCPPRPSSPRT